MKLWHVVTAVLPLLAEIARLLDELRDALDGEAKEKASALSSQLREANQRLHVGASSELPPADDDNIENLRL